MPWLWITPKHHAAPVSYRVSVALNESYKICHKLTEIVSLSCWGWAGGKVGGSVPTEGFKGFPMGFDFDDVTLAPWCRTQTENTLAQERILIGEQVSKLPKLRDIGRIVLWSSFWALFHERGEEILDKRLKTSTQHIKTDRPVLWTTKFGRRDEAEAKARRRWTRYGRGRRGDSPNSPLASMAAMASLQPPPPKAYRKKNSLIIRYPMWHAFITELVSVRVVERYTSVRWVSTGPVHSLPRRFRAVRWQLNRIGESFTLTYGRIFPECPPHCPIGAVAFMLKWMYVCSQDNGLMLSAWVRRGAQQSPCVLCGLWMCPQHLCS